MNRAGSTLTLMLIMALLSCTAAQAGWKDICCGIFLCGCCDDDCDDDSRDNEKQPLIFSSPQTTEYNATCATTLTPAASPKTTLIPDEQKPFLSLYLAKAIAQHIPRDVQKSVSEYSQPDTCSCTPYRNTNCWLHFLTTHPTLTWEDLELIVQEIDIYKAKKQYETLETAEEPADIPEKDIEIDPWKLACKLEKDQDSHLVYLLRPRLTQLYCDLRTVTPVMRPEAHAGLFSSLNDVNPGEIIRALKLLNRSTETTQFLQSIQRQTETEDALPDYITTLKYQSVEPDLQGIILKACQATPPFTLHPYRANYLAGAPLSQLNKDTHNIGSGYDVHQNQLLKKILRYNFLTKMVLECIGQPSLARMIPAPGTEYQPDTEGNYRPLTTDERVWLQALTHALLSERDFSTNDSTIMTRFNIYQINIPLQSESNGLTHMIRGTDLAERIPGYQKTGVVFIAFAEDCRLNPTVDNLYSWLDQILHHVRRSNLLRSCGIPAHDKKMIERVNMLREKRAAGIHLISVFDQCETED